MKPFIWNGKPIPPFACKSAKADLNRTPDYMSMAGAKTLAIMILTVWHGYGHTNVTAEPEVVGQVAHQSVYRVVTNLVNGLPPLAP